MSKSISNPAERSEQAGNPESAHAAADFTTTEIMTIAASRLLKNNAVCFVGIGLPSTAANLARFTHAPDVVLIYESGPIGAKPHVLPLSIGDGDLAETADTVVSTPEIFRYWLQGGRIDVGFLGAAQIDRFANINTTVIGDYHYPKTRLPGAGGAPEIASCAREVFVILKQTARAFVEKLDFITSVGFLDGGDARVRLGLPGKGPVVVVTDLCIMQPDPQSKELTVTSLHPGVTREQVQAQTGWPIRFAEEVRQTPPPTPSEMEKLRDLERRTAIAHQRVVGVSTAGKPAGPARMD
jgi:glutaconate CoA-transferase subunit B